MYGLVSIPFHSNKVQINRILWALGSVYADNFDHISALDYDL